LPFRDGSIDAVTSSIGLVVITPLSAVMAEITRVLRPGGVLAAIAPALRPLSPQDLRVLARINARLRAKPQFPGPVELAGFTKTLQAYGMRRVEDQRERYRFRVTSRADAEVVLSALYLPQTRWSRVESAIELLQDRVERKGSVDITIPMRRVVAIK
jgi:SAM-dependent methyltransferase